MNALTIPGGAVATMTSREIAELTGKEHAHVMRDIRAMLEALKKDASSFGGIYLDAYGREKPCFNLDRELTLTLVSGYDIPLRHRVVTRLAELEAKPAQSLIPQTLPEALRLAADLADQRNVAQAALEIAAPKAKALDRIAGAEGMLNLQTTGKVLQQPPNKFIQKLRELHWIFKRPGAKCNSAHVDKINSGYLATKAHEYEKPDGTIHINDQVMVTPKGLAKLALIFGVQLDSTSNDNEGIAA